MNDKNMFSGPHIINYVIIIVFSSIFVSVAPSDQAKLNDTAGSHLTTEEPP